MTPKFRKADAATVEGRLRKAEQFMEGAETIRDLANDERDVGDAYVTLCIHAGIAAADVVCSVSLGEHTQETITTPPSVISPKYDPMAETLPTRYGCS